MAAEADDLRCAAFVVGTEYLAEILWIQPFGERGRTHQIAEQHGQLPALGLFCLRRPW